MRQSCAAPRCVADRRRLFLLNIDADRDAYFRWPVVGRRERRRCAPHIVMLIIVFVQRPPDAVGAALMAKMMIAAIIYL